IKISRRNAANDRLRGTRRCADKNTRIGHSAPPELIGGARHGPENFGQLPASGPNLCRSVILLLQRIFPPEESTLRLTWIMALHRQPCTRERGGTASGSVHIPVSASFAAAAPSRHVRTDRAEIFTPPRAARLPAAVAVLPCRRATRSGAGRGKDKSP